jgi:hypothetical protein
MEPLQILLIFMGIVSALGGIYMLVRASRDANTKARGPYVPLAMTFIGVMIAYRAFSDYRTLDGQDFLIMFLFSFALLAIIGAQIFIVERNKKDQS